MAITIKAPFPGTVQTVSVKVGDKVADFDPVLILEAMKMENEVLAEEGGIVKEILVKQGEVVTAGQILLTLE